MRISLSVPNVIQMNREHGRNNSGEIYNSEDLPIQWVYEKIFNLCK